MVTFRKVKISEETVKLPNTFLTSISSGAKTKHRSEMCTPIQLDAKPRGVDLHYASYHQIFTILSNENEKPTFATSIAY